MSSRTLELLIELMRVDGDDEELHKRKPKMRKANILKRRRLPDGRRRLPDEDDDDPVDAA
jgi:hypothetical protein